MKLWELRSEDGDCLAGKDSNTLRADGKASDIQSPIILESLFYGNVVSDFVLNLKHTMRNCPKSHFKN